MPVNRQEPLQISVGSTLKMMFAIARTSAEFVRHWGCRFCEAENVAVKTLYLSENVRTYGRSSPIIGSEGHVDGRVASFQVLDYTSIQQQSIEKL
jgi:hypothetical protein